MMWPDILHAFEGADSLHAHTYTNTHRHAYWYMEVSKLNNHVTADK